ncbi:hypothetical protein PINS_up014023 [Pythium insidiosum]|nr:hypothetical protein PINS_up014023 [Pythium insidiosum]
MAQRASRITSVGFVGSGRLAELIARNLVKKMTPERRFCYKKQRLVSTMLASDPSQERRKVFDGLGFTTTEKNQDILSECDVVFLGTNAREALATRDDLDQPSALMKPDRLENTLFVSLMGDLPADQVAALIGPGAKVIRMMPQHYLEETGLVPKGTLPPKTWATARNSRASREEVQQVVDLAGIDTSIEVSDTNPDLWAFNIGAAASEVERAHEDIDSEGMDQVEDDEGVYCAEFHDEYLLGDYIGKGRFAHVYKAVNRQTGEVYAVKCVKNDALTDEARDTLIAEVAALSRFSHPGVIGHHGLYAEDDMYYLVLDYCDQGSVRRHLRDSGRVTEAGARDIIRQLLQAIEYCHSMSQVHRDIKAENVLLKTDPADPSKYIVKLGDFGLSKELDLVSGYLQDVCGTPQYLSPEIVSGRTYGKPADIWSTGILSYMLLSGRIPFDHAMNETELFKLIRMGAVMFHYPEWKELSPAARDIVQRMLELSPDARPSATELLQHEWFRAM